LNTSIDSIDLSLRVVTLDVPDVNLTRPFNLTNIRTPNTADSLASADFVFFTNSFPQRFHVLEGEAATVELLATVNAGTIQPTLFLNSLVEYELDVVGFGSVSGNGFITVVPEPSGLWLFLIGAASLCARRLRLLKESFVEKSIHTKPQSSF